MKRMLDYSDKILEYEKDYIEKKKTIGEIAQAVGVSRTIASRVANKHDWHDKQEAYQTEKIKERLAKGEARSRISRDLHVQIKLVDKVMAEVDNRPIGRSGLSAYEWEKLLDDLRTKTDRSVTDIVMNDYNMYMATVNRYLLKLTGAKTIRQARKDLGIPLRKPGVNTAVVNKKDLLKDFTDDKYDLATLAKKYRVTPKYINDMLSNEYGYSDLVSARLSFGLPRRHPVSVNGEVVDYDGLREALKDGKIGINPLARAYGVPVTTVYSIMRDYLGVQTFEELREKYK